MSAVLGGTQSLHTNGFDEALSLPTENAARIALRTQQIIAHESGVTHTVDPLAGSYFVEELTSKMESEAQKLMDSIEAMGGAVNAVEEGFIQDQIAKSSYDFQKQMEACEQIIVGVNKFEIEEDQNTDLLTVDEHIRTSQIEKLRLLKSNRDENQVNQVKTLLASNAKDGVNLMPTIISAVEAKITLGEIADIFRDEFGEYQG